MTAWKNKHLKVAMLMAPVLGLVSYFAFGVLLGEKPHAAIAGQSYLLVEKPNCRYSSGRCGLKNGEVELEFSFQTLENGRLMLALNSDNPLDGVMLALVENEAGDQQPVDMRAMDDSHLSWTLDIEVPDPDRHRLHLVASLNRVLYYGDVATSFTYNETQSGSQQ